MLEVSQCPAADLQVQRDLVRVWSVEKPSSAVLPSLEFTNLSGSFPLNVPCVIAFNETQRILTDTNAK